MATTSTQVKAALEVTKAIADAIRELGEVPSGTLYASTMSALRPENYEAVIGVLIRCGLVERDGSHLLRWIGPAK